jgi:hypothetical protein
MSSGQPENDGLYGAPCMKKRERRARDKSRCGEGSTTRTLHLPYGRRTPCR